MENVDIFVGSEINPVGFKPQFPSNLLWSQYQSHSQNLSRAPQSSPSRDTCRGNSVHSPVLKVCHTLLGSDSGT